MSPIIDSALAAEETEATQDLEEMGLGGHAAAR
jgi:hypothetical protein